MRYDTSQQKAPILFYPEKLISRRVWKPKSPKTPNPTLSSPDTNYAPQFLRTFHSEEILKNIYFSQESFSSPRNIFLEPTLKVESFESMSFFSWKSKRLKQLIF